MTQPAFFRTNVVHRRMAQVRHDLSYKVGFLKVDLANWDKANAALQSTPFSLRREDYAQDGFIRNRARMVSDQVTGRIVLITMPRLFGYGFNPLSAYLVHDAQSDLPVAIVYEVRNTFGERHHYQAALPANGSNDSHEIAKSFHVSPFLDDDGHYRFNLTVSKQRFTLAITKMGRDGAELYTRMDCHDAPLTKTGLWRSIISMPFQGIGVMVGIHWEAAKLWVKGAPFYPYSKPNNKNELIEQQITGHETHILPIKQRVISWSHFLR